MCVIAAMPPHKTATRDQLERACKSNPHGFGWAIATKHGLIVERSMTAKLAIDSFLARREMIPEAPALFHARITTHGTNSVDNCHPFRIGGDSPNVAIAHNGILPCEPGPFDSRSDSRYFAEDVLPSNGGFLSLVQDRTKWEQWMGWQNKMVAIASINGSPAMVILNREMGDFEDGIWWSNRSYQRYTWQQGKLLSRSKRPDNRWPTCEVCNQRSESVKTIDDLDLCSDCERMLSPETYWPTRATQECEGCGDLLPKESLMLFRNEALCSACLPSHWEPKQRQLELVSKTG